MDTTVNTKIIKELYTLPPSSHYPFYVLSTHYYTNESALKREGLTLLLVHAVGMHKESWEVIIQILLESKQTQIRDVFSIESPNHGESAALNENAIRLHTENEWATKLLAQAIHEFINADPSITVPPHFGFKNRRLVGVGHSIGAAAVFLTRDIQPSIPFESVVAVEPGISTKDLPETAVALARLVAWTWLRRDVWPSRKAAKKDLEMSPVFGMWDPRALDLYVKYGLRAHPAHAHSPPFSFRGVTTCIAKTQEAACYRSKELLEDALEAYSRMTGDIPVHLMFGKMKDLSTPDHQRALSDNKQGRKPASLTYIDGAGHLAVQQRPDTVAELLLSILRPTTDLKLMARL